MPVFTITVSDEAYPGFVAVLRQFFQQGQPGQFGNFVISDGHQATAAPSASVHGLVRSGSASLSAHGLVRSGSASLSTHGLVRSASRVLNGPPSQSPVMRTESIPRILAQTQLAVNGVISLTETMGNDINDLQEVRNDVDDVREDVDAMKEDVNKIGDMQGDLETVIRKVAMLEEQRSQTRAILHADQTHPVAPKSQTQPVAQGVQEAPAAGKAQTQLLVATPKQRVVTDLEADVARYKQKIENIMLCLKVIGFVVFTVIAYASVLVFGPGLVIVWVLVGWVFAGLVLRGYRFKYFF